MKRMHLGHCLVGMAAAVALLLALGVQGGTILAVGAALLCPITMVFCLGHMFHRGHSHHAGGSKGADNGRKTEAVQR